MVYCRLQVEAIETAELVTGIGGENDGAVVFFYGQARNHSKGRDVNYLEYQVYHEMAEKELQKIIQHASSTWELSDCVVIHRYGRILPGETSIVIGVSSSHRDEAYTASRYIIDTIKKKVPIWKKEFYSDGSCWITKGS